MRERIQPVLKWFGKVGIAFGVFLLAWLVLRAAAPNTGYVLFFQMAALFTGCWLGLRGVRILTRRAIWRLRNRLLVAYLFIALVPVLLIATLFAVSAWALASQVAVYLVTSELERRVDSLRAATQSIEKTEPSARADVMRRMTELFYKERFPGIQLVLRQNGAVSHYPDDSTLNPPPAGWKEVSGVVNIKDDIFMWSHRPITGGSVTAVVPLTSEYLAALAPQLGNIDLRELVDTTTGPPSGITIQSGNRSYTPAKRRRTGPRIDHLPPPANRFDSDVSWLATLPVHTWDAPEPDSRLSLLVQVQSRISAVYGAFFSSKVDTLQGFWPIVLTGLAILFFVVELMALMIGVSMTRAITGAVHHLYDGTQKIMEGNFAHRIDVKGNDQLAELSGSFNRMTENLEQLLVVAKEKERLQSEIEIAREVQGQLYPRAVPGSKNLRLTAVCHPARMVSGDYYDYQTIRETRIAIAVGDVAGKGISAALLMATLQSSLHAQLQSVVDGMALSAPGATTGSVPLCTSGLVGRLNVQLYNHTAPEKYATFFFAIYDETTSILTYTNAGHLPPILVRQGEATRLDVNGTVVGAFPFSNYDESSIELLPGDLLMSFTDGITEPENEYGEMFGEDRLVEIVTRNAHKTDAEIVSTVMDSVLKWTGSPELQDDMTLLLARRV